jgi:hypothetical protein
MLGESVSSRTRPGRVSVLAGRVGESICQAQAPHRLLVRQSLVVENHGVLCHFPCGVGGSVQAFAAGSDEPTAAGCLLLWAVAL